MASTPDKKAAKAAPRQSTRAKAREGKKAVVGYYSPKLSKALHTIATNEETTMQSLLGEAIDLLFAKRGMHPMDER